MASHEEHEAVCIVCCGHATLQQEQLLFKKTEILRAKHFVATTRAFTNTQTYSGFTFILFRKVQ